MVVDVYRYEWWRCLVTTKYWVRPITKRLAPETLYALCEKYVSLMWPAVRLIGKLPKGRQINWSLLIADYRGVYALPEQILKEWAMLDTFDMLSPRYDSPQSLSTVIAWFAKAGLENTEVHYGCNGIEGRGAKPNATF